MMSYSLFATITFVPSFSSAPLKAALSCAALRCSVMSVAYMTTLNGLPCASTIGLYVACTQTSRPSLVVRRYWPDANSPFAMRVQKVL